MKKWIFACCCLVSMLSYGAPLLIGTLSDNPPFEEESYKKNNQNNYFGFDIAIMTEICTHIQSQCDFKSFDFHQFPNLINSGKIDLGIAMIIITPEREKQFAISLPYLDSYQQFMTLAHSNYRSIGELTGKRIGVYKGSPTKAWALNFFKGQIKIVSYPHSTALLNALDKKEVDAIITGHYSAVFWQGNAGGKYKFIGGKTPIGEGYGIIAKPGQRALINKINRALLEMENDGTYLKIYTRYFSN
ncbi:transporter substrate-binding domain-containing protein [Legionella nagasakiensis]|uniref:transporter substrate-binding domain-containing protein n=1 Tax=Legionella nagasakiensis TaxID=535290 RepID=UPI001054C8B2|nr:transporter substrate-binding domain-containing protein [Legionella nagasakiensis]